MHRAQQFFNSSEPAADNGGQLRVQKQLKREITCLERQLERLRLRRDLLDDATLSTYEDMIMSRQAMLDEIVCRG